ncbi:hypothetical protein Y032_0057g2769 [Ancylostoma ceylanicum]|uniref:Uncharacterized protein n=1 Tax=Ancylostoma ceylanicum TaxID=53326 RepID=A0A016U4P6_9BILA|nr:hypothetical protein Y032_0057g2769 [Ancylostoma ceylanicum]
MYNNLSPLYIVKLYRRSRQSKAFLKGSVSGSISSTGYQKNLGEGYGSGTVVALPFTESSPFSHKWVICSTEHEYSVHVAH